MKILTSQNATFLASPLFISGLTVGFVIAQKTAESAASARRSAITYRAGIESWFKSPLKTAFIEPDSSWKNDYNESFNGRLRAELLDRENLYNLKETKVLIKCWRKEYNSVSPRSSLGYRPPTPEAYTL